MSVYYSPEDLGLEVVASLDPALSYEFDMVVVWKHKETEEFYWASDAGCFCLTPFEAYSVLEDLHPLSLNNMRGFEQAVKNNYGSDNEEKRAFLRKVEEAIRRLNRPIKEGDIFA